MRITSWISLIIGGFVLALMLRYGVIQPSFLGLQCASPGLDRPFWCAPREALILIHVWNGWSGLAGASLAAFAFSGKRYWLALGFLFSALGIVIYNTGLSSLGFLLSLYLLGKYHHEIAR